jgi:antitoxin component YwqK of YwqJK toxin-antitoxin module
MLEKKGKVVFNESEFDYRKIGKWSIYDTAGRLVKEEFYVDGVLDKEKSL